MFAWNTERADGPHAPVARRQASTTSRHLNADRPELNQSATTWLAAPHEIAHELWDTLPARLGWRIREARLYPLRASPTRRALIRPSAAPRGSTLQSPRPRAPRWWAGSRRSGNFATNSCAWRAKWRSTAARSVQRQDQHLVRGADSGTATIRSRRRPARSTRRAQSPIRSSRWTVRASSSGTGAGGAISSASASARASAPARRGRRSPSTSSGPTPSRSARRRRASRTPCRRGRR